MSDIVFGDLFKKEISKKYQISEDDVTKVIKGPDEVKRINLEFGHELIFYLKQMPEGYHLLVDCHLKGNQVIVITAYKIFPDLLKEIDSDDPLVVLEKFANKFGLPIQIGGFEEKYIAGDSFPVGVGQDPRQIVKILNPQNHSLTQSMMMRVRNEGQFQFIDVSVAYCIDKDEYGKYLAENQ